MLCLRRGWIVHATTRSPAKHEERMRSKLVPDGVPQENLKIFACDLLKGAGEFKEAFSGVDVVLHTASLFFIQGATEENVVRPAVEGTRAVLSAVKEAGIKRVITSSTAAIMVGMENTRQIMWMTEADWSDEEALIKHDNLY